MLASRLRLAFAATLGSALLSACGGSGGGAASAPVIAVEPGDSQVIITWVPETSVEYWLWYKEGSTVTAGDKTAKAKIQSVISPYVVTGLTNDTQYAFTMNGRTGGGEGGPGSAVVTATPSLAGGTWANGSTIAGAGNLRSIAYGPASGATYNTYVAVGDGGQKYRLDRPDWNANHAATWTAIGDAAHTADVKAALYAISHFITAGAGGELLYSTDISTWTAATVTNWAATNPGAAVDLNALATNGSTVVAVGNGGAILHSTDGTSWTAAASPNNANLYGVTYSAKGVWIAVGAAGTIITSTDGSTWIDQSVGGADLRAVSAATRSISGTTRYDVVAVGDSGRMVVSTDGLTTRVSLPLGNPADTYYAVSAYATRITAIGSNGAVYTTDDTVTWTQRTLPAGAGTMYAMIRADNRLNAVGADGGSGLYSSNSPP